jgi:hypothetical protein
MSAHQVYLVFAAELQQEFPEWRSGQCHFNALMDSHPNLAEMIRGTDLDPFFQDKRLPDFLKWVEKKLSSQEMT